MKQVTITLDFANAVLQSLGNRPYAEVAGLIAEVKSLRQRLAAAGI